MINVFRTLFVYFLFVGQAIGQTCGDRVCGTNENCIRDCQLDTIVLLTKNGGRLDWSPAPGHLIAFDRSGPDGFFDLYVADSNLQNEVCLTCGKNEIPQKHNGQPAWHPSGEWIVFQSEKAEHPGNSRYSTPGRGVCNDLWLTDKKGKQFYRLTNLPAGKSFGVLHPHFSHDGKMLSWSEMYAPASFKHKGTTFGQFKLKVADFAFGDNGVPILSNIREYIPGDSVLYENHGFSPDGGSLIFMSNFRIGVSPLGGNKIYRMDLATGKTLLLTGEGYNEHACFSPEGRYIVWGTNRENKNRGMDYWVMEADGSMPQRLTYFNQKGYMESSKQRLLAVDMSWSADGKKILSYVQDELLKDKGRIYLIRFREPVK